MSFRIISGGIKGSSPQHQIAQTTNELAQQPQEQPQEGWGGYAARNIAQFPTSAYGLARSGLGLGDLLQLYANRATKLPQNERAEVERLISPFQSALLPYREAKEEARSFIPSETAREYVRERPEDQWAQFALTELPLYAAGGAFKSIPSLLKALVGTAGLLGGSEIGKHVGGNIGETLGDREIGELIGGLGGGFGGSMLGHIASNRPSRALSSGIESAERSAFEGAQAQKVAKLTQDRNAAITQLQAELGQRRSTLKNNRAGTLSSL
jgi:hypothetical protein